MSKESDRLAAIARPHASVADKIRALSAAGVPRADIARFLGKRYQHVRNVLEGDAQSSGGYVLGKADLSGVQESGPRFDEKVDEREWVERRGKNAYWLRPRPDGSLVLPKEVAEALGLAEGHRVFAEFTDAELKIVSFDTAFERARAIVRKFVPPGSNVVDEFLAERRAMWGEDDGENGA
jgi:hypothetical protein